MTLTVLHSTSKMLNGKSHAAWPSDVVLMIGRAMDLDEDVCSDVSHTDQGEGLCSASFPVLKWVFTLPSHAEIGARGFSMAGVTRRLAVQSYVSSP